MAAAGAGNWNVVDAEVTPFAGLDPPVTATLVVSDEHIEEEPLVRVTENGGVPPVMATVAETVAVCPTSSPAGASVRARDRAGFTV